MVQFVTNIVIPNDCLNLTTMNLLSIGVPMAQAHISVLDARSLGLIPYLIFLKVKVDYYKSLSLAFYNSTESDVIDKADAVACSIDRLVDALIIETSTSRSTDEFTVIDQGIKLNQKIEIGRLDKFNDLLENLMTDARAFIKEPTNHFSSKIQRMQSLAAIHTYKELWSISPSGMDRTVEELISNLTKLKTFNFINQEHLELEVA